MAGNTDFTRYYRVIFGGSALRTIAVFSARDTKEAFRYSCLYASCAHRRIASIYPITKDQIRREYKKINFRERIW